jgi:ferredoxin
MMREIYMADNTTWLPHINLELCIGCADCIAVCPTHALGQQNSKAALIHPNLCTYCILCEDICPVGAIELPFLIVKRENIQGTIS